MRDCNTTEISFIFDNFYPKLGGGPIQNRALVDHLSRRPEWKPRVFPLIWERGLSRKGFSYPVHPIRTYDRFPVDFNRVTPAIIRERLTTLFLSTRAAHAIKKAEIIHTDLHSSALVGAWCRLGGNHKLVIRFGGNLFRNGESRREVEDKYDRTKGIFFQWPARLAFRAADAVIVNGSDLRDELIGAEIPSRKIHVIPVGVDTSLFRPPEPEVESLPTGNGRPSRLLYFGRITEANGPLQLLEILEALRDRGRSLRPRVVGDGPLLQAMKARAEEKRLPVEFLPPMAHEDLAGEIAKADLCVFPFRKIGGVSSVVTESMACGRPVFAAKSGDLSRLIRHGENGFLTPVDRPDLMAEAVDEVLMRLEVQLSVSRNAVESVRREYGWEQVVDRYTNLYRDLMEASGERDTPGPWRMFPCGF